MKTDHQDDFIAIIKLSKLIAIDLFRNDSTQSRFL
jgi:hypothetical protein